MSEGMSSYDDVEQKYGKDVANKLSKIDKEIEKLYLEAKGAGLTKDQICQAAEPLLKLLESDVQKKYWRKIGLIWLIGAIIVGSFAAVLSYEPTYRLACAYSRLLFIKTLPYWDWTVYYKDECLIKNPYYEEDEQVLNEEDCEACHELEAIERVTNVSQLVMSDDFIKREMPVIVTDVTETWPATRLFSLTFLNELYQSENMLRQIPPCFFGSNLQQKDLNIHRMLADAQSGKIHNFYAYWENCEKPVVRFFRRFYRRPYFIPPMVEAIDRNWLFISTGYTGKNYKPVEISAAMMWMAQVQGTNKIKLTPRHPCNETCSPLYAVLHEGEAVVWTDFLWTLEYLPIGSDDRFNVAIGSGGSFD